MLCILIVFISMFYQEQMSSRGHREETQSLKKDGMDILGPEQL